MSTQLSADSFEGQKKYSSHSIDHPGDIKIYRSVNRIGMELLRRLRRLRQPAVARQQRLALIARIPLGPNQTVALIEAEGEQFLVATSGDGTPSFYALHSTNRAVVLSEASAGRASC